MARPLAVLAEVRSGIKSALKQIAAEHPDYQTVVVGHSLGGAIAELDAVDLRNDGSPTDLYTHGAPRTGSQQISDYITSTPAQDGSICRITHYDDPIPKLPSQGSGFRNVGPEYWISTGDRVNVTADEPINKRGKRYLTTRTVPLNLTV